MKKKEILSVIKKEVIKYYQENLVSLVIFGSFARNEFSKLSDIDLLIICRNLAQERMKRVRDFERIENSLEKKGFKLPFSPIIKTKEEVEKGSPLFFDMIEDSIILYDRGNFFKNYLKKLKSKLDSLGAKKIKRRGFWFWVLKKDYKLGEVFSI